MLQRLSVLGFSVLAVLAAASANAQDTRSVSEPVIPPICSTLTAEITSSSGDLSSANNGHFDTSRIQAALSGCASGQAVELQPAGGNDAFQIQPITIPAGVTLLVDPGATVYASINPRDYDVSAGSCGIVAASSAGCKPLIGVSSAANAAIMGGGVINGRGGDTLTGLTSSWWQLSSQAQTQSLSQFNPRLIQVSKSNNFTLYQITLVNAPLFHVTYGNGSGFTAWGVTINTPNTSRNTDGIDPGNGSNFTVTESSISDGDDNIAIGASNTATANATISNNYFGSGHGVSIGSITQAGVSNVAVSNLSISGTASDGNDTGIRIKSDSSRGGLVQNVSYSDVCMQNVAHPIQFNPFYTTATGSLIPSFQNISLHNVHVLTEGKVMLEGHDATHLLGLTMDNVIFDKLTTSDVTAQDANITLGPGPANFTPTGTGVTVTNHVSNSNAPFSCTTAFPGHGTVLTVGGGASGSFSTVQAAVNALPSTGGTININPGTYTEVVHINTPNVRLVGLGAAPSNVVITFNNSAGTSNGSGGTLGTNGSATVFAHGDGFFAQNLTIQNTFDLEHNQDTTAGAQAVALFVDADKAVFRNVRLIGRQDTLWANGKGCSSTTCTPARQYFYNSYIEGNVDFIFGDAAAVFDHCIINVDEHGSLNGETTITAQSKLFTNYLSGFVFINSVVQSTPATGFTELFLGRPWKTFSTNIFVDTYMAASVNHAGWIEFTPGTTNNLPTSTYAEYRSFGPGAAGPRESHATTLSAAQSQAWEPDKFLNGSDSWHPTLVH